MIGRSIDPLLKPISAVANLPFDGWIMSDHYWPFLSTDIEGGKRPFAAIFTKVCNARKAAVGFSIFADAGI